MEIKLYLEKINQEMIDIGRRVSNKAGLVAGCDLYGSWPKECCVLNFGKIDDLGDEVILPEKGWMLRKEDVGGLMWDPSTGAVYQLDEEAYHTLLELNYGFSDLEVSRRMRLPIKEVTAFTRKLKRITG